MLKALLIALALPGMLFAEEPKKEAAPAQATAQAELKVGTGVENKDVTGAAAEFKVAAGTKLYAWARVSGLAADGKVTLSFVKGDKVAYKQEFTVGGSPWRTNISKTFRAWDAGDWTAKAAGADGTELGSVPFKVEIEK